MHVMLMYKVGSIFYLGPDMMNHYKNVYTQGEGDRKTLRRNVDRLQVMREDVYKLTTIVLLFLIFARLGR